jgi:integrase
MKQTRERHQKGSLRKQKRSSGREVWVFRWREVRADGTRRPRKLVVGAVEDLRTEAAAWREVESLELNINLDLSENGRKPQSFAELIAHYEAKELAADNEDKSYATKDVYHRCIWTYIRDRWGSYSLDRMENGIAVHVEEWLKTVTRKNGEPLARSSKSKIRNIMSAICSHAMRYGWMKHNPMVAVRQSAKRQIQPEALDPDELQRLINALGLLERMLVLLDVPTGMRVSELLALQWEDFDWARKTVTIRKSIWHQHLGPVKTDDSLRVMPLADFMVKALREWHAQTAYAGPKDWVFASAQMKGRQPLWPCGSCVTTSRGRLRRLASPSTSAGIPFGVRFQLC